MDLKDIISNFPTEPGVYLMKNQSDKILYIGKAKNLRNRVRSYFAEKQISIKTQVLVQQIKQIDYILTHTEVEAFLLEASLIKKHKPKYNIRLKDDKEYPYIKLSWQQDYPRLFLSRKVIPDGGLYFGPYTRGVTVHETIRFLNKTFKIRDCSDSTFKTRKRPCITHQIGRCDAPCVALISKEHYRLEISAAIEFLKGNSQKLLSELTEKMRTYADEEKFELAAKWRDSISAIEGIMQKQDVVSSENVDLDVFGICSREDGTIIEILSLRHGRVTGSRPQLLNQIMEKEEDSREWILSFLNQYYDENLIPDEVLLSIDIGRELTQLFENVLKERSKKNIKVRFPTDQKGRSLLEMAELNAGKHYELIQQKKDSLLKGLQEIQVKLHLTHLPQRIEAYDISHFQGKDTVGSQVVFLNGSPHKEAYRRYKIRSVKGIDDYKSMKEVLQRRLNHLEQPLPNLILIDGGRGQLQIAQTVLKDLNFPEIALVGLAKARTQGSFTDQEVLSSEERFFIPGRQNPVVFKPNSEAFRILITLRDEAHRFALQYHKKLRERII